MDFGEGTATALARARAAAAVDDIRGALPPRSDVARTTATRDGSG
ncbi:MAG: hypothetical protein WD399_05205 [Thermoleophilaceae bacterium]